MFLLEQKFGHKPRFFWNKKNFLVSTSRLQKLNAPINSYYVSVFSIDAKLLFYYKATTFWQYVFIITVIIYLYERPAYKANTRLDRNLLFKIEWSNISC